MFVPKPSESGSFELAPAGTHVAICYRFIDRGTQVTEYMGDRKTRREVMLSWELCGEQMTDGRPFSATKTYTWSMHEKATLRKDLEAWRGRAFTDEDFDGPNAFNTKKLLGAPCMISITHETKGDRTYAKIVGIGKLAKGFTVPELINPVTYLALSEDGWNAEVFAGLSDKMREIVSGSPEYRGLTQRLARHDDPGANGGRMNDVIDDDIPF